MNEKILKQLLDINLKKLGVLKLFLKNPNIFLQIGQIIDKVKIKKSVLLKYLKILLKIGFLKKKKLTFISSKNKKKKEGNRLFS